MGTPLVWVIQRVRIPLAAQIDLQVSPRGEVSRCQREFGGSDSRHLLKMTVSYFGTRQSSVCPHRLVVRTSPSHGDNVDSTSTGDANCSHSTTDRAMRYERRG